MYLVCSDMMFSNQASTERSISAQMALIQNENNVLRQQLGSTVQSVVRIQVSLVNNIRLNFNLELIIMCWVSSGEFDCP